MKIVWVGRQQVDLHSPADCARASPAALQAFVRLCAAWGVPASEARTLLGRIAPEEFARLCASPAAAVLAASVLKRISCLLSIWRELSLLYGPTVADEWVRLPNTHPMFSRVTPLTYMLIGGAQALMNVQRLLVRRRRAAAEQPPPLPNAQPPSG